jgi:hypothetical protein
MSKCGGSGYERPPLGTPTGVTVINGAGVAPYQVKPVTAAMLALTAILLATFNSRNSKDGFFSRSV